MLNGNELMLGDYVNIADYNYPEVVGKIKAIYTGGEEVLVNILEDSVLFDTKDISEISLSKTFFLENGFEELLAFEKLHINETYSLLCNVDIKVVVKIMHEKCFRCEVYGIEMNYVHEFQHLMRLLGLFDYANNLKV